MANSTRRSLTLATVTAVLGLAAAAGLLRAPAARADADPASDVLLTQSVFLPYAPAPSPALRTQLTGLTADAAKAGFPIKVAIIGSAADLGAVSDQFGRPQSYADFLSREISFNTKQALLVVMPSGFGTSNVPSRAALSGLTVDAQHETDGLARSAISAVLRLAASAKHPLKAPAGSGGSGPSSSSGTSPGLIVGAIVGLLALAGLVTVLTTRAKAREEAAAEDPGHPPR